MLRSDVFLCSISKHQRSHHLWWLVWSISHVPISSDHLLLFYLHQTISWFPPPSVHMWLSLQTLPNSGFILSTRNLSKPDVDLCTGSIFDHSCGTQPHRSCWHRRLCCLLWGWNSLEGSFQAGGGVNLHWDSLMFSYISILQIPHYALLSISCKSASPFSVVRASLWSCRAAGRVFKTSPAPTASLFEKLILH